MSVSAITANIQNAMTGTSPLFGMLFAALAGAVTQTTGLIHTDNIALYIALCGMTGAGMTALVRYLIARGQNQIDMGRFIDQRAQNTIERLMRKEEANEKINALRDELRHDFRGWIDAAINHIRIRDMIIEENCPTKKPIAFQMTDKDVAARVKEIDKAITAIKMGRPPDDSN